MPRFVCGPVIRFASIGRLACQVYVALCYLLRARIRMGEGEPRAAKLPMVRVVWVEM